MRIAKALKRGEAPVSPDGRAMPYSIGRYCDVAPRNASIVVRMAGLPRAKGFRMRKDRRRR